MKTTKNAKLQPEICRRLAKVRLEMDGPRGKAAFSKRLGLSPSTYDYYESSRVPPADILVRVSEVAGVDLRWLLTGEASQDTAPPANHPVLRAAAALLARCEAADKPLAAFVDILGQTIKFPAKGVPGGRESRCTSGLAPHQPAPAAGEDVELVRGGWIPVLGRSAAGVPHFWADEKDKEATTTIDDLLARSAGRPVGSAQPALAVEEGRKQPQAVQIITLTAPGDNEADQYVEAPVVKGRHADAFALRIDGQSMAPEVCHGDIVILSPSEPAAQGRAAVVQMRRQIGVTCKLFRRQGSEVHLVPVNEAFAPQTFDAAEVVWALRVLATVRPGVSAT